MQKSGAPGESRTPKIWFLRPTRIPFRHLGLVRLAGLEPACLSAADFKSAEYTISPQSLVLGTPAPSRTENTAPFERADFANLSTGVLVRMVGLEPTCPKTRDFKSLEYTISPHPQNLAGPSGIEPSTLSFGLLRDQPEWTRCLVLVPQERFELSKAGLLRTVAVPVCISHRGELFGAASWNRTKFPGSSSPC